ncbi:MAG: plasmid stabilization protein [Nitrococcus mobilis]|nr:plasmid stabilization protein [Nitrococcus mobilis]
MASITIRNLDDELKARLRRVAAEHGHSMEEEARRILRQALAKPRQNNGLGSRIHKRYAALGGIELEQTVRTEPPRAIDLDP